MKPLDLTRLPRARTAALAHGWTRRRVAALTAGLALGALCITAQRAHAQQAPALLDAAHSSISFVSTQMGVPVNGRFQRYAVQATLDPKALAQSHLSVSIDMTGATLDNSEIDEALLQPEWFGSKRFPKATFVSTAIKRLAAQDFEVSGTMTIKGRSLPIKVPLHLSQNGTAPHLRTVATGAIQIRRLAFGVGQGQWADTSLVADAVDVKFSLTFTGIGAL